MCKANDEICHINFVFLDAAISPDSDKASLLHLKDDRANDILCAATVLNPAIISCFVCFVERRYDEGMRG